MNIILTGAVAVGKSTLQERIKYYLKHVLKLDYNIYPEFIYNDILAEELIKRRFTNDINNISALTFQSFIMDKWLYWAKKQKYDETKINIFERLPEDAVEVFSKMVLTNSEYKTQEFKLEEILKLLPVSYKIMNSDNTVWIKYKNNWLSGVDNVELLLTKISELIEENKFRNIVIEITSDTAFKNCQIRNRAGEQYTEKDISFLNERYDYYTSKIIENIKCEVINI